MMIESCRVAIADDLFAFGFGLLMFNSITGQVLISFYKQ